MNLKNIEIIRNIIFLILNSNLLANAQSTLPNQAFLQKSFTIPAKLQTPFHTGIQINKDDFVYFEVLNMIRVGFWYGNTSAVGLSQSNNSIYNKYKGIPHGALVWQIGDKIGNCQKMFQAASINIIENLFLVSKSHMITHDGSNYVAGNYFLWESKNGELVFDINDNDISNNLGKYDVQVFVLSKNNHQKRNSFNYCPLQEPPDGTNDKYGDIWIREYQNSWVNHGFNNSYRGQGKIYSGCQCVYDHGNLLLGDANDKNQNQGTFDFGFWMMNGKLDDSEAKHFHLILDMLPHELWEKRLGTIVYNQLHPY